MKLISSPKKIMTRGVYRLLSGEAATDEYLVGFGKNRKKPRKKKPKACEKCQEWDCYGCKYYHKK